MVLSRKNMKAEQAYFDQKAEMYFWSPDGFGGFWYDTLEELEDQHGETAGSRVVEVAEILD